MKLSSGTKQRIKKQKTEKTLENNAAATRLGRQLRACAKATVKSSIIMLDALILCICVCVCMCVRTTYAYAYGRARVWVYATEASFRCMCGIAVAILLQKQTTSANLLVTTTTHATCHKLHIALYLCTPLDIALSPIALLQL